MRQSSKETMMLSAKTFPFGADRRESAVWGTEEVLEGSVSPYGTMPDQLKAMPQKTLR